MALRIAFVGFRHGHVRSLFQLAQERQDVEIVAVCEEDAQTRSEMTDAGIVATHSNYESMLSEVDCDVVACGDYFGARGQRLIAAMERGRHVISDKPLCTSLDELDAIARLAKDKSLSVGCMLDLGNLGPYIALRNLIRQDLLGEILTLTFWGQHPLLYGTRPMWNFEECKHGGTINDIAIHAVDIIPWMTGLNIQEITAARVWNQLAPQHPHFQDGGLLVLKLDNGAAAMGDVSYHSPNAHGYTMPQYWRFTISGTKGVAETSCSAETVDFYPSDGKDILREPIATPNSGGYFNDFRAELAGSPDPEGITTQRVLQSSRIALLAQKAAEEGRFPVGIKAAK
jgi:predicted dehydrogenase